MSASKKTGVGNGGPSKPDIKGKGKANSNITKASNIETKANVRDAIGGIEIETEGGWMPAVYLDEIRERVLRDTNAQGSYDHQPTRGNLALDVTAFHLDHKSWGEAREQRPKILFEYKRNGRNDPDYDVGIWMDNGRVVLGPDGLPIRDFHDLPKLCSSQMEGFRMEAISRLDSRISISDFRARMMRDALPGANAISMRKTRFRNKGRCMAWDRRAGTDFYEVNLKKEMTQDMINRNSTEELEDLSSAKAEKMQLDTAGKAPARSGKRALSDDTRALRLKTAREKNQKKLEAEAKLKQENMEENPETLGSRSRSNNAVNDKKRKRTTESGLADTLHDYVDELFGEFQERPSKNPRNHESPSGSPDVLKTKKRKRTAEEEFESNDEETDEVRTVKRSRRSNLLDLLPSAFSLANPGASLLGSERVLGRANMASTTWPSASNQNQASLGWEDGERAGWRDDSPPHQSQGLNLSGVNTDVDDRDMLPATPLERVRVQNALSITRHHYEYVTGLNAPETDPYENYLSQYGSLQARFNEVWRDVGIENPALVLAGIDMWLPGSLRWNQGTNTLLSSYGADARRLLHELEHEIRGGLAEVFNQHPLGVGLMQNWRSLAQTEHVDAAVSQSILDDEPLPATEPPTAFEQVAALQPAAAFNPCVEDDPSLSSRPAPADQPSVASNPSVALDLEPLADVQPARMSDQFMGFDPLALWSPTATSEAQAFFTDAEPRYKDSNSTLPVAVGTTAGGNENSSLEAENKPPLDADDIELVRLLNAELAQPADPASRSVSFLDVDQPGDHTFDNSFFDDAFGTQDSSSEDLMFSEPQAAQTSAPHSTLPEQTVRPDEVHTARPAEDFEMVSKYPDFWLS